MPFDRTITEEDLDSASEEVVRDFGDEALLTDADFEVDGMEESVGSRIFGLLGR